MRGPRFRAAIFGFALVTLGFAQELDTAIFRDKGRGKPFTVIDQIADPKERRAFLTMYDARAPQSRRKLAESFVSAYPQSWLLAQAYEIAAKACIDLEDYQAALRFGAQSLQLLPENPLLLVPLANAQAQVRQFGQAEESARAAIEYLKRFDRPASVSAGRWPSVRAELQASAYFVLGRVNVARGLQSAGAGKEQRLLQAEEALVHARSLNAGDGEIAFLLGLAELTLGKQRHAAFYFAEVGRTTGPLQAKALENLKRIYASRARNAPASFEAFLTSVGNDRELDLVRAAPRVSAPPAAAVDYSGSPSCQPCHTAIYRSWQQTGMSRMLRAYRPQNVMGDFRVNNKFADETGSVVARAWIQRDKHFFAVRDTAGEWRTYPVDYTIGSKWQQAYATRLPSGELHVFPIQYSGVTGQWINYWKVIDPPDSQRAQVTHFNRLSPATSYQMNCAPCHTSQLRLTKAESWNAEDVQFRETGINCEMCHGPGSAHVLAMTPGQSASGRGNRLASFRTLKARDYVAVCAQCHAQSALRQPGPNGEINYAGEGVPFPPVYLSRPYSEASRKAFYKDGRFRETTFIVEAFWRTACFRKGQAHCGSCHDVHAPDAASNPTSLKFRDNPDRMCLQCHGKFASDISSHTHHPASSEASRCVTCHMPRIMNSVLFRARTHQIDDVPNPEMTARFGLEESPNACLECHKEKDASWAGLRLQTW